jgi:hypothetical protein
VAAKLDALKKKGSLEYLGRLRLTAVEAQPVASSSKTSNPFIKGVVKVQLTGNVIPTISYQTLVNPAKLTAAVTEDNRIRAEVDLQNAWVRVPEGAELAGIVAQILDDEKKPLRKTEIAKAAFAGTLHLAPGQAAIADSVKTTSDSGEVQALMIVGARVVEHPSGKK